MTTCITATDTFSADGTVVLLERGTKLVGETRGQVQQGAARIFVLWTEARTPTGVVVPLSSPGTDELGRSGLPGEVNRHFWDRFGAAILLTVINGAVQGAVNPQNSGGLGRRESLELDGCDDGGAARHGQYPADRDQSPGRSDPGLCRAGCGLPLGLRAARGDHGRTRRRERAMTGAAQTAEAFSGSALELTLRALRPILSDPRGDGALHQPTREAFVETRRGWEHRAPCRLRTLHWCQRFAKLIANSTRQRIDEASPLLSASLPSGERAQIVLPPATRAGTVAITLRRPSNEVWSMQELAERGHLSRDAPLELRRSMTPSGSSCASWARTTTRRSCDSRSLAQEHPGLRSHRLRQDHLDQGADPGDPGRGAPDHDRGCARSSSSIGHPNHVRLFYSKDDQGLARVTPKQLLESCLRMKPDRILLAELRAEEAFDYLRNVNSGHPGSITSIHAGSCELAFEQLVLLVKQSPGGRELARRDIKSLLYLLVDVVIQFGVERHERFIKEIWYEPERRRRGLAEAG